MDGTGARSSWRNGKSGRVTVRCRITVTYRESQLNLCLVWHPPRCYIESCNLHLERKLASRYRKKTCTSVIAYIRDFVFLGGRVENDRLRSGNRTAKTCEPDHMPELAGIVFELLSKHMSQHSLVIRSRKGCWFDPGRSSGMQNRPSRNGRRHDCVQRYQPCWICELHYSETLYSSLTPHQQAEEV